MRAHGPPRSGQRRIDLDASPVFLPCLGFLGRDFLAAYQAACAAWLVHLPWEVEQQGFWHAASGDALAQIHALQAEQQFVAALHWAGLSAEIGCPTSPVSGTSQFGVPEVTPNFRQTCLEARQVVHAPETCQHTRGELRHTLVGV